MYYFEWKHYYIQPLFHYYWNTNFVYILIFLDIVVQLTIVLAGKVTDSGEKVTCQHYFKILFLKLLSCIWMAFYGPNTAGKLLILVCFECKIKSTFICIFI